MRRVGPALAASALVVYWALWTLAAERAFGEPRWLHGFIYDDAFFVSGAVAAIIVGTYVGRWWVLGLAATPITVWVGLETVGHVAPYHEAAPPLTHFLETSGWWLLFWLYVTPLALGVILRKSPRRPAEPANPVHP